jgi:hypothetical protein
MAEMQIKNAQAIDISLHAPPTAIALNMTITVSPPSGAVLVYSPRAADPIRFNGPHETKDVPIDGPTIYIQLVQGAASFQIRFNGWEDGV